MQKFKPFLKEFIQFYYKELGNISGGYLHIALDDGNLSFSDIEFCIEECLKNNDSFGFFLGNLMLKFTEEELEAMYDDDWFGLQDINYIVSPNFVDYVDVIVPKAIKLQVKNLNIELVKRDLISLVKGTDPSYDAMSIPLVKKHGKYHGGFNDEWQWDTYELEKLTEQQLYELYSLIKKV